MTTSILLDKRIASTLQFHLKYIDNVIYIFIIKSIHFIIYQKLQDNM